MAFKNYSDNEDFVEYFIYPDKNQDNSDSIETLKNQVLIFLKPFLTNYVWTKDSFNISVIDRNERYYLRGKTNIGDNIEDEWFIVSLLLKLSIQFPELVLRVADNDGEFPLIEAADFLPSWAQEPDNTENRLYIKSGLWHLIPMPSSPSQLTPLTSGIPEINNAVETVRNFTQQTVAHDNVQKCLKCRIKSYPDNTLSLFHHAHVEIPQKLAVMIENDPSLITPAIRCFHEKDNIDERALKIMKHFPPKSDNFVKKRIKFPKNLYAMLDSSKYIPARKSGWSVLSTKSSILGMKLTCGFEILTSQYRNENETDSKHLPGFDKYINSLKDTGYFKELLPGSREYKVLEEKAFHYFKSTILPDSENSFSNRKYSTEAFHAWKRAMDKTYEIKEFDSLPDDDDSWLEFDQNNFDKLLESQFKLKDEKKLTGQLKSFMESMSDFNGIEHPSSENKIKDINFNLEEFEKIMKSGLQLKEVDDEDSSEDEEEIEDEEMINYFEALNSELSATKAKPHYEEKLVSSKKELEDIYDKPLDIDLTVLKNLQESLNSQGGDIGPTSTILDFINKK